MDSKFHIKEYCKYIMPSINGYGAAIHEITGEKIGYEPLAFDHTFGADEGLNPFVRLGGIEEAQQRILNNKQPENQSQYSFHIITDMKYIKEVNIAEVETNKPYKIFRFFWDLVFCSRKEGKYLWFWLSPGMYSVYHKNDTQHSLLKIDYPTRKLVFKAIFHPFYPIYNNPRLIMVQENGKEQNAGTLKEVNFHKEPLGFNFEQRDEIRCFTITVNNPKIGWTYKVIWKVGYNWLSKYLSCFESSIIQTKYLQKDKRS